MVFRNYVKLNKSLSVVITLIVILGVYEMYKWNEKFLNKTTIIVITPTHKRPERLADMTRFAQTLMHISNLHWIVIEDSDSLVPAVERILKRIGVSYNYLCTKTAPGFPAKGWTHRNFALDYIRKHYRNYKYNAVIYFADDDNSYDLRLFNNYVRNVKTIGIWAVGLSGGALVEAPNVTNGVITGWNVIFRPDRKYGTDMAGFAVNLKLILNSNASFSIDCINETPETCFLSQIDLPVEKFEPFGCDSDPKEIMVWHTKTKNNAVAGSSHGYVAEL